MAQDRAAAGQLERNTQRRVNERVSFYVWTAVGARRGGRRGRFSAGTREGGTTDPTALPPGHRLSHTTVVLNSAILVLREGLETILVLAAVTASFRGGQPASTAARSRPAAALAIAARGRHLVLRRVADRALPRRRVRRAGRDRPALADRAAARDELVLPQGLLDRLDLPPQQAAARPALRRSRRRTNGGCCSASRCSASPRSTASASRS